MSSHNNISISNNKNNNLDEITSDVRVDSKFSENAANKVPTEEVSVDIDINQDKNYDYNSPFKCF